VLRLPNTSEAVRRVIEGEASIRRDLAKGLINTRALARYIQQVNEIEDDQEHSLDAIISTIRRYPISRKSSDERLLYKHMANKKLIMRNKIVEVAIRNDSDIPPALGRFSSQIDYSRSETFRIVAGLETTRVIIDEKNLEELLDTIPKEKIKKVLRNLAEILILLPETTEGVEAERVPGVVATLSTELTLNGISMTECMSCAPDIIIVVEEKNAIKAYELIDKLQPSTI